MSPTKLQIAINLLEILLGPNRLEHFENDPVNSLIASTDPHLRSEQLVYESLKTLRTAEATLTGKRMPP